MTTMSCPEYILIPIVIKVNFIPFAAHQEAVGRTKLSANQDVLLYNLQVIMIRTIGDDPVS